MPHEDGAVAGPKLRAKFKLNFGHDQSEHYLAPHQGNRPLEKVANVNSAQRIIVAMLRRTLNANVAYAFTLRTIRAVLYHGENNPRYLKFRRGLALVNAYRIDSENYCFHAFFWRQ